MLETFNNFGYMAQPFGLRQEEKKHPLEAAGTSMKLRGGHV